MELNPPYHQMFISLGACAAVLACISWGWIAGRLKHRQEILPWATGGWLAPWGLAAVLLFVCLVLTLTPLINRLFGGALGSIQTENAERLAGMAAFSVSSLLSMALTVWILLRRGTSFADLGLSVQDIVRDLKTGAIAFGLICVPLYGLQALLGALWKSSEHPIIEILSEDSSTSFFAVMTVSAVVVAPLVEELFFRVLLQGWFEKVSILFATPLELRTPELVSRYWWGAPLYPSAPKAIRSGSEERTAEQIAVPMTAMSIDRIATWPVVCSAVLFAVAHAGYGPDPIPLFFLACALGFIYRRTRRVWPCIFLHMLVNGTSMFMLWLLVNGGTEVANG